MRINDNKERDIINTDKEMPSMNNMEVDIADKQDLDLKKNTVRPTKKSIIVYL